MTRAAVTNSDDSATGLPLLRTWRAVYVFVLAVFVLTAGGLAVLTLAYR